MSGQDLIEVIQTVYFPLVRNSRELYPQLIEKGFELSLEDLVKNEPRDNNLSIRNYYRSLVLTKMEETPQKNLSLFKDAATLFYTDEANKSSIAATCDEILLAEIANSHDLSLLDWCEEGKKIKDAGNFDMSCLQMGKISFTSFMWQKASEIDEKTSFEDFVKFFDALKKAKSFEFEVSELVNLYGNSALEFIERDQNCYELGKPNQKGNLQNAFHLLRLLSELVESDQELQDDINQMRQDLKALGMEVIYDPSNENTIENTYKDVSFIDSSCITKIEPPIYALKNNHFQVCIYKAILNNTTTVAVKMYIPLTPNESSQKIMKEIQIYQSLSEISSPTNCFLKFYGSYIEAENKVNIVIEFIENNLMKYITHLKETQYVFPEDTIATIFFKLLTSFGEMETRGIYHGDIKPQNLLVDQYWNIKIIDFNYSVVKNEEITQDASGLNPMQGTEGYRAPEVDELFLNGVAQGKYKMSKSDVFSLGIVFLQLILLSPIKGYNTKDKNRELQNMIDNNVPYFWAKKLLKNMLSLDPKERKKFKTLVTFIPIANTPSVRK